MNRMKYLARGRGDVRRRRSNSTSVFQECSSQLSIRDRLAEGRLDRGKMLWTPVLAKRNRVKGQIET